MEYSPEKLAALLAPISETAPTGSDLNYSALFDEIREARRSDDPSLDQGEWEQPLKSADWRKVIRLCEEALTHQSKDLQLIVWHTEALTYIHGFLGASFGFQVLEGWLQHYWDNGYPPLEANDLDERIGKIEWLNQQIAFALRTVPLTNPAHGGYHWNAWQESRDVENIGLKDPEAKQRAIAEGKLSGEVFDKSAQASGVAWFQQLAAQLNIASQSYQALDETSMERFGDDFPSMAELWQTLRATKEVVERVMQQQFGLQTQVKPTTEPSRQEQKAMPETQAPRAPATQTTPVGSVNSRAEAIRQLDEVARYFRANEPHSPVALLAERAARWAEMSLEQWLAHVIKDDSTLNQLNELLDVKPGR